jgi:hypothetical protein
MFVNLQGQQVKLSNGRNLMLHKRPLSVGSGFLDMKNFKKPAVMINRVGGFPNIEQFKGKFEEVPEPPKLQNLRITPKSGNGLKLNSINSVKIPTKKFNNLKFEL